MIKEIKLSSLNNVIPKVNKKEPPRISNRSSQSLGSFTAATSFSWASTTSKAASEADKRQDI